MKTINRLKITSGFFLCLMVVFTVMIIVLICCYGILLHSKKGPSDFLMKVNTFFLANMPEVMGGFGACVGLNVILGVIIYIAEWLRERKMGVENDTENEIEEALLKETAAQ